MDMLFRKARLRVAVANSLTTLLQPVSNLQLPLPWDDAYFLGFLFGFGTIAAKAFGVANGREPVGTELGDAIVYGFESLAPKNECAGIASHLSILMKTSELFREATEEGSQAGIAALKPPGPNPIGSPLTRFHMRLWPDMADRLVERLARA